MKRISAGLGTLALTLTTLAVVQSAPAQAAAALAHFTCHIGSKEVATDVYFTRPDSTHIKFTKVTWNTSPHFTFDRIEWNVDPDPTDGKHEIMTSVGGTVATRDDVPASGSKTVNKTYKNTSVVFAAWDITGSCNNA